MTREQIIKGLECCSSTREMCDECPYGTLACIDLIKDALALVRELTEENARLREKVSNQREELRRFRNRTQSLEQSRNAWKEKAKQVGLQLAERLSNTTDRGE